MSVFLNRCYRTTNRFEFHASRRFTAWRNWPRRQYDTRYIKRITNAKSGEVIEV